MSSLVNLAENASHVFMHDFLTCSQFLKYYVKKHKLVDLFTYSIFLVHEVGLHAHNT